MCNWTLSLPELVRIELLELLEREAAMLMALDRREAGMLDWPARLWTVAAPIVYTRIMIEI